MRFCDADACSSCSLADNECACLKQKGEFCIWLSARPSSGKIRRALEKLGLDLIAESEVLGKQRAFQPKRPTR
jgi:hypothetical protein